jgi:hypothetical protein
MMAVRNNSRLGRPGRLPDRPAWLERRSPRVARAIETAWRRRTLDPRAAERLPRANANDNEGPASGA